jgi:uncharacterized protein YggE
MCKSIIVPVLVLAFAMPLRGQVTARRPFVRALGEGVVPVRPDQVKINVGVTTQAETAQASAEQNAARTGAVLNALRQLLGANADIKTVSYAVTPNYRYPQGGGTPTLLGYTTANVVEVTVADATVAGRVIDTATQAGANTVTGLRFTLRDSAPARSQALRLATQQARSNAESIAMGLGLRLGAIVSAEEGSAVRAVTATDSRTGAVAATPTPVETGMVEVRATVVVEIELQ